MNQSARATLALMTCNGPTATYRGGHLGMVAWKYYEAVERKAPVFRPGM